jgi:hypothetical protein
MKAPAKRIDRRVRYRHRRPKVPGSPARRTTTTYRDPDDRVVHVDRAVVQQRILAVLAPGPHQKWQIREALHIAEIVIADELQALRAAGRIKRVGRQQQTCKWALADWQPAPTPSAPPIANEFTAIRPAKPAPAATDSWWTRPLTREAFQERARRGADGP